MAVSSSGRGGWALGFGCRDVDFIMRAMGKQILFSLDGHALSVRFVIVNLYFS